MFNRSSSFYKAHVVVLVCVKSPKEYECVVLHTETAEKAAQINLDREYRTGRKKDGLPKKPGKVWMSLDYIPNTKDAVRRRLFERELELLNPQRNNWEFEDV